MPRRRLTLGISAGLLVVLVVVAGLLRVPYVILLPGPVTDTLGNIPTALLATGQKPGPVISISGKPTQPPDGRLYLTTVSEQPGSCSAHPTLWQTFRAWLDHAQTVEPQQVVCPPGQSSQQVEQQGQQEMTQSQTDATTAALFELGYRPSSVHVSVGDPVASGSPADGVLEPGDVILSVDGTAVSDAVGLRQAIQSHPVGTRLGIVIQRDGRTLTKQLTTVAGPASQPIIGISVDRVATFPGVTVKIGIAPEVVNGPSAGTALALGIVDKLTPGGLTGGRTIAGTGTVNGYGLVGPIGGIQQKIAAAVSAHASVFFAPASECADAKAAAPASLTLVRVDTLHTAVTSLKAIKAGSTHFPHC